MGPKLASRLIHVRSRGQDHQQQADAVHADLVLDAEERDPGHVSCTGSRVRSTVGEAQHRDEREPNVTRAVPSAMPRMARMPLARHEGQDERADERREDDEREDGDAGQSRCISASSGRCS